MPLQGIKQLDIIQIDDTLRLTKYKGECAFALPWYKDEDTLWLLNGDKTPYSFELLQKMYDWQNNNSELYFIEVYYNNNFHPIGDVAFSKDDMAIVIGDKNHRGKKIAKRVIQTIINRAKTLGFKELNINEIYTWNKASQNLFTKQGFKQTTQTKNGYSYKLML